jgi:large subunit ribosomal protein L17
MRHRKHNHQLGVKSAHRVSLVANLSCSLIEHGRIKTTLAKARALRPSIEKVVTLAKKAHASSDPAKKIHYRRLAIAKLRNKAAVTKLFDELVDQFLERNGGYTRIYKLALPRLGDAADMALIEFVEEAPKKKTTKKKQTKKKAEKSPKKSTKEEQEESPIATSDSEKAVEAVASEEVVEKSTASEEISSTSEDLADLQGEAPGEVKDENSEGSTESK